MKKHFSILKNNATKLAFAALLFFVAGMQQVQAQYNTTTIKIGSVANSRWNDGYTFGGQTMSDTQSKLLNAANFGTGGTVSNPITITPDFATNGSITAESLAPYDVLFIGFTGTPNGLTAAEINAIKTWTLQAGKVVIVAEQPQVGYNPLTVAYGYPTVGVQIQAPVTNATTQDATTVQAFSGPFGPATNAKQGGGVQGVFDPGCFATVFGRDANGKSTLIFDEPTRDILLSDGDFVTNISGAETSGSAITTAQDKFIANVFAWAIREVLNAGIVKNKISATASCTGGVGTITFTSPIGNSSGGSPYQYSIDGTTFQTSPTFNNVADDTYTIYAKTAECPVQNGGTITVNCTPPCPAGTTAPPVN